MKIEIKCNFMPKNYFFNPGLVESLGIHFDCEGVGYRGHERQLWVETGNGGVVMLAFFFTGLL